MYTDLFLVEYSIKLSSIIQNNKDKLLQIRTFKGDFKLMLNIYFQFLKLKLQFLKRHIILCHAVLKVVKSY